MKLVFDRALALLMPNPGSAVVAVSGGADSVALLDLMATSSAASHLDLTVAHYDHGIGPDSSRVAEDVRTLAERYDLPVAIGEGRLGRGCSETKARRHRRAWLEELRVRLGASYLVTAHHAGDQIETLTLRFLAGSGPAGMAGIRSRHGPWVRPLLRASKGQIIDYVSARGLSTYEDPENADCRHLRNWVRHELVPAIESRVPRFRANVLQARSLAAEQRRAWTRLIEELPGLDFRSESNAVSVAAASLVGYSSPVARSLVRALARRFGRVIGASELDRIERLLSLGRTGQLVDLKDGYAAELSFGRLRLFQAVAHPPVGKLGLTVGLEAAPFGDWLVSCRADVAPTTAERGGFSAWFTENDRLSVRSWVAGDRIRPLGGSGRRLVVRCMQDAKVPRSRRPNWPVVMADDEIVWVPGVCRGMGLVPAPATNAMRVDVDVR